MFTSHSVPTPAMPVEIFESLFTATDDMRNDLHELPIKVKALRFGPLINVSTLASPIPNPPMLLKINNEIHEINTL